jgi:uncharacterized repeat protein (TIGR04076 family)
MNMVDKGTLDALRGMLGYTDSQWDKWKSNDRNMKVAENLAEYYKYKLVAEVTSSYGCAVQHKVGDRIVFGTVALVCKENPDQICYGLLLPIIPYVQILFQWISNGEKPSSFVFPKVHCVDVGVEHGGWGEVIAEVKVEKI